MPALIVLGSPFSVLRSFVLGSRFFRRPFPFFVLVRGSPVPPTAGTDFGLFGRPQVHRQGGRHLLSTLRESEVPTTRTIISARTKRTENEERRTENDTRLIAS